jgi:hypothetical protein
MTHLCHAPRRFTDRVPTCRLIAGYALTVAMLAADPAGDRSEELNACWGVLVDLVSAGLPRG